MRTECEVEGARVLEYKGRSVYWERFKLDTLRYEGNARFLVDIQLDSNQIPRDVARPADRRCEIRVQGSSLRVCPSRTLGCVRSGL